MLWSFALAAIPIERTRVNRRSADTAAELLEDGWNLVIFPEGGRSPDGWTQPFRGGAAYLARRTGRPVVPVYLHGTRDVLPKAADSVGGPGQAAGRRFGHRGQGAARLRRSPVTVLFGAPLTPDEGEDARRFAARIEAAVAVLADEMRTDWWTARRRAAAGTSPSPRGPEAPPGGGPGPSSPPRRPRPRATRRSRTAPGPSSRSGRGHRDDHRVGLSLMGVPPGASSTRPCAGTPRV